MTLADLVPPGHILVPLEADTLRGAAAILAQRMAETGVVRETEKLQRRIADERGEDIVALGDRAFVAHYRTDAVNDLGVALGVSPTGIVRAVSDGEGQQARVVLLLLAPPRLSARYLQVLGAFARLFADPRAMDVLLGATSAADITGSGVLERVELPPQLTVREIMTERPRTTTPESPLREAAREVVRSRAGALPVTDGEGHLVGMLSEKELMRHMLSHAYLGGASRRPTTTRDLLRQTVRDVMTRQVLCVSPDQPLAEVASLMINKDVDSVPVVRAGELVGLLTRGDIVRKLIAP